MLVVTDIRRRIEGVIEADPVIKKGLQRGIINSRALARFIQETNGVESTTDAILGVIRRYDVGEDDQDFHKAFKDCELSMRNKVGDLALENNQDTMRRIAEFAGTIQTTKGEGLRIVVGLKSIRVVAEQKALDAFRRTLPSRDVISYGTDLVEISLLLPPETQKIKGIIARITTELALNDVNLVSINCCSPEDILLVAEKDAPRALETLQRLLREEIRATGPSIPLVSAN